MTTSRREAPTTTRQPALIPTWSFGDRLRKIRRTLGLSQREFAKRIGISPSTLEAWETGRNRPTQVVEVAQAVEEEFGVPATWTLGLDDPSPQTPTVLNARRRWMRTPIHRIVSTLPGVPA